MNRLIGEVMTTIPVRVEETASLETARRMMERYGVRHLPVIKEGKLVGVISERELNVALAIARSHTLEVTVQSAMQSPAFQVEKSVPVADVVERMAKEKFGCAVISDRDGIRGIFTTTDALVLLTDMCRKLER
jgi:acetoin utilization protein AcuB